MENECNIIFFTISVACIGLIALEIGILCRIITVIIDDWITKCG